MDFTNGDEPATLRGEVGLDPWSIRRFGSPTAVGWGMITSTALCATRRDGGVMFRVEVLPARYGDCLWIEYGTEPVRRVLIDGGAPGVYKRTLRPRLERLGADERTFELLVITHVDYDHIKGILELAHDESVGFHAKDVWFNGYRHLPSLDQREVLAGKHGEELTDLLVKRGSSWNQRGFAGEAVVVPDEGDLPRIELDGGLSLTLLAPTIPTLADLRGDWEKSCQDIDLTPGELEAERVAGRFATLSAEAPPVERPDVASLLLDRFEEDHSTANGSSIAFVAEYEGRRVLFAGDAHPTTLVESITRMGSGTLRLDACKLPHHGSRGSVSADLIRHLDCDRYVFSSNGDQFQHPHPQAVARVIEYGGDTPELLFNYRSDETSIWDRDDLRAAHGYSTKFPDDDADGITLEWTMPAKPATEPPSHALRSTRVEFARFDALDTGMFRTGDRYLRTIGDRQVSEVEVTVDQREFNTLMERVRYASIAEDERLRALDQLAVLTRELLLDANPPSRHVAQLLRVLRSPNAPEADRLAAVDGIRLAQSDLLAVLDDAGEGLHHVDLVANPAELSAVPFECAPAADGTPLFLSGDGVVITRRVRGDRSQVDRAWPTVPKVLFAWSHAGGTVPDRDHRDALVHALKPWIPPHDPTAVFVEVPDATLDRVAAAVRTGAFSHVHLLAHGATLGAGDDRFGLALNDDADGRRVATPEELCEALAPTRSAATVVTLAACDAGNQSDTITTEKSIAHQIHVAGIPVVVASQLPFTVAGSTLMTETFYGEILSGVDARRALHDTRVRLHQERDLAGHDWVSLVAYARLPHDYVDVVEATRLDAQLAALRNLSARAGSLSGEDPDAADDISSDLTRQITRLEGLLVHTDKQDVLDENRGLLGSAEKRLAELLFRQFGEHRAEDSRAALARSRDWYRAGFAANPSAHWLGVQYLALDAAIEGTIDPQHWRTTCWAAEVDRTRPGAFWALGTLAELAMLASLIDVDRFESAEAYLQEMKTRVAALPIAPTHDPLASTRAQFRRYVDWWRPEHGYFSGSVELAERAEMLATMLAPG